jgi:tetratricopeptide (TPR) repeat protein
MAYEATRDFDKALQDLDRLLHLDRSNDAAMQAKERINRAEVESAAAASSPKKQAAAAAEDGVEWEVEGHRRKAQTHLQNGEPARASTELEKALSVAESGGLDKQSLSSLKHMLATAYAAMDDNDNALRVYSDILKNDGQNHKANLKAGETHLRMVT